MRILATIALILVLVIATVVIVSPKATSPDQSKTLLAGSPVSILD